MQLVKKRNLYRLRKKRRWKWRLVKNKTKSLFSQTCLLCRGHACHVQTKWLIFTCWRNLRSEKKLLSRIFHQKFSTIFKRESAPHIPCIYQLVFSRSGLPPGAIYLAPIRGISPRFNIKRGKNLSHRGTDNTGEIKVPDVGPHLF